MEVTFHNLGCFPHFHIELPLTGLLSLTAKSGTGKSTWFDCLIWILTGKPKSGIIYRDAKNNEEAWGKLTLPDLVIHRKRGKDKIEVVTAEGALEGAAAQAYLDERFGNFELVCASAYSKQEEYHPLLKATAAERLELMQSLVKTSQKPAECIAKVVARLRDVTTVLTRTETKLKTLNKDLTGISEEDFENLVEDADTIEEDLNSTRAYLLDQEAALESFHRLSGEAKALRKTISGLKSEVEFFPEKLEEARKRVRVLEAEQKRALTYWAQVKIKERAATLLTAIAELPSLEEEPENFDLKVIRQTEAKYEAATKLMKACQLEYNEEVRKAKIKELTAAAEYYKWEPQITKLAKLEKALPEKPKYSKEQLELWKKELELRELEALLPTKPNYTQEELESWEKELELLKLEAALPTKPDYTKEQLEKWEKELELHTCPACEASLRFRNNKLILESTEKIVVPLTSAQIKETKKKVEEYNKQVTLLKNLREKTPKLETPPTLTLIQIKEAKTNLQEYLEQSAALRTLREKIPPLSEEIPLTLEEIGETQKKLEDYSKQFATLKTLRETVPKLELPKATKEQTLRLAELKSIECLTAPVISSATAEAILKRREYQKELADFDYEDLAEERNPESILKELKQTEKLVKALEQAQIIEKQKVEHTTKLKKLEEQIEELQDLEKEILAQREKRDLLEKQFARWHTLTEKRKVWQKREKKQELLESLQREQRYCLKAKSIMIAKEYCLLEEQVNEINLSLTMSLKSLFEKPLEIRVKTEKESKTTDNKTSQITMEYRIGSSISDTPKSYLSKGEQHRVSVALFIAFAARSRLPFLILDEETASQNAHFCEAIRESLREALPEKLVIVCHHNDTVGDYDCAIDLEEEMIKQGLL